MEWLHFEQTSYQQYIPRSALDSLFDQEQQINQLNAHQSPRMNKNAKQKQNRMAQASAEPTIAASKLPQANISDFGLPQQLYRYLEVSMDGQPHANFSAHLQ
jgi:hypothetical protein